MIKLPSVPRLDTEVAWRGVTIARRAAGLAGRSLGRLVWRRKLLVLVGSLVVLRLTAAHVAGLTPIFEAATLVSVDDRPISVEDQERRQGAVAPGQPPVDQVALIETRAMAGRLIDRLDLQLLAEFNPLVGAGGSHRRSLIRLITKSLLGRSREDPLGSTGSGDDLTDLERAARLRELVVEAVRARIEAGPAEPSTVRLKFLSEDRELAAAGANALAEIYLEDRLQRASQAEQERLEQEIVRLTASISDTEQAIEELRTVSVPGPDPSSERDFLGLTAELAFWRGERAEIEARLHQGRGVAQSGADMDPAAWLADPALLGELDGRGAELERGLAVLSEADAEKDPRTVSWRHELEIQAAQGRSGNEQTAEPLSEEVAIIRSRETALEAKIAAHEERVAENLPADGLAALEQRAEADRELLQSYLERADRLGAPQRQQPGGRILAAAVVPQAPAYPHLAVVYASALGGGLLLGLLLALTAEALHRARA